MGYSALFLQSRPSNSPTMIKGKAVTAFAIRVTTALLGPVPILFL
jgi:hypothetical protein